MLLALLLGSPAAWAVEAVRTTSPITVDGRLDEAAWSQAKPITHFLRFAPTAGGPPPGTTDVRVLYDDQHLYIGVHVDQARPVRYRWAPREDVNQDDQIGIFLDTFHDGHSGYVFYFNPLGVQQDFRVDAGRWDISWDAVMDAVGRVHGDSWDLEVSIPFRSLKYPAGSGPEQWGLIVQRIDVQDVSLYSYPEVRRDDPEMFTHAAPLDLTPAPRGSGLEVQPSVTAVQQGQAGDGPMTWTGLHRPLEAFRPSLDVRFGLTPNIGVTGTINPDFSQVENDETPIDLNQRFAFSFPEHRPFFLDGADLFADRHDVLYTRSIVEPVAGIKVGGKEGHVSVGILNALDRSPAPSINEHPTPGFGPDDVKGALAENTVGRIAVDAFGSGLVGLVVADKRIVRAASGHGGTNDVLGLDFYAPLGKRWVAAGGAVGSLTGDDLAPPLLGGGIDGEVLRQSGEGLGLDLAASVSQPGLRMETSYAPQTGIAQGNAHVDYTFEPPVIDTLTPAATVSYTRELDGGGQYTATAQVEAHKGAQGVRLWYGHQRFWQPGGSAEGLVAGAWYWARPTGWLEINPTAETGKVLDYATLVPARSTTADLALTLWPTRHIRLDTSTGLRWLAPDGGPVQRSTRVYGKLGYQFSRVLGARVIGEYAGGTALDHRVTGSVLLTWLQHPGTAVWLGYAETGLVQGEYTASERTAFAKVSVLFRP